MCQSLLEVLSEKKPKKTKNKVQARLPGAFVLVEEGKHIKNTFTFSVWLTSFMTVISMSIHEREREGNIV